MTRERLVPPGLIPSDLPLSPGVRAGSVVAVSGQVGLDPATGRLAGIGVRDQTWRALSNLEAVLAAAGLDRTHVFKTTVFLVNASDFGAMNEVYRGFFSEPYPARSTVVVELVRDDLVVEIEALASTDSGRLGSSLAGGES